MIIWVFSKTSKTTCRPQTFVLKSHCKIADIHARPRLHLSVYLCARKLNNTGNFFFSSPSSPKTLHLFWIVFRHCVEYQERDNNSEGNRVREVEHTGRNKTKGTGGQNIPANWLPTQTLWGLQEHGSAAIVRAANCFLRWEKNKYLNILRRS